MSGLESDGARKGPPAKKARRDDTVVEELHGHKIADPYRWLEDPDAPETVAFVEAQNQMYDEATIGLQDLRSKVNKRLTEIFNFPKFTCYSRHGGKLFFEYNTGLQQQSVLFVQEDIGMEPAVLLDPNTFSDDGTVALRGRAFSRSGGIMSYGVSSAGSDWTKIKFIRVDGKEQLPETLEKVKFSCQAWLRDEGIFYNRYLPDKSKQDGTETEANRNQKLFYHKIGTSQDEDILVFEIPDEPEWMASAEVTDDDRYLLLFMRKGCNPENLVWVVDLETTPLESIKDNWTKVINTWDGQFDYIANDGQDFVFTTTWNAPKKRLVRINSFLDVAKGSDVSSWVDIIPESAYPLEAALAVAGDFVIVEHMKDVKSSVAIHKLTDGAHVRDVDLPIGSLAGLTGKRSLKEVFFKFISFLEPGVAYRLADVTNDAPLEVVKRTELAEGLDLSEFETNQYFFDSEDGTKIPIFVMHRKDIVCDGSNPAILYGYGGFNISQTPSFSVSRLLWCNNFRGVFAVANIRGGGEYGLAWHNAGRLKNKQNCFTDFQCAAKSLVQKGYTSADKLCIQGGSNGGLLVCACANQAPSLFRVVVSQVGVLDMLRFHKFTIGHAWTSDFGDPENADDFKVALAYSPLHNIKTPPEDGSWQYPSILMLTADHDDRVVPLHSLKVIAELQHTAGGSKGQTNPLLIRVDTKAGHGAGKPTTKVIEDAAHIYAFVAEATGAKWV